MGLSAGADVREQLDEEGGAAHAALRRPLRRIVAFPKPTVAACHGYCVGGGAESPSPATSCGGSNLRLRFPGAALGVPVGPARLVTLCGLAVAKYLLLSCGRERRPGAPLGLVNRVAPAAAPRRRRWSWPTAVAAHPPEAVARLKRMLHEWDDVEGRSRAEGEGQVEWQRSGPGLPGGPIALDGFDQSLTVAVTGPTGEIGKPFLAALERVPEVERVIGHGAPSVRPRRTRLGEGRIPARSTSSTATRSRPGRGSRRRRPSRLRHRRRPGRSAARSTSRAAQRLRRGRGRRRQAARLHLIGRRLRVPRGLPELISEEQPAGAQGSHPYSAHKAEVEAELAEALEVSGTEGTSSACIVAGPRRPCCST